MFSVVVPLFNKERSVQKTIRSVLDQSVENLEIIVVDDGSTDASIERVQEFTDARIKIIRKENGGVSETRNAGIKAAKYDYIALLDADDIWEPEYLEEQVKLIREFPDAALWSCAYGHLNGEERTAVYHALPDEYRYYISDYFRMKRVTDLFCSSSVVIRKKSFDKAGMFDTRISFSEDLDMWYRIIVHFPVVFYNKTLVYYRQDAENRALHLDLRLKSFLPYYVNKYNEDISINDRAFLYYINNWSAVKLLYYYFDTRKDRAYAKEAVKNLNYKLLKKKYIFLYKTPFVIGYIVYQILLLKKKIW